MDTKAIKKTILDAFYEIVQDLTLEELEDLKDVLSVQEFYLTDSGQRFKFEEVKNELAKVTNE